MKNSHRSIYFVTQRFLKYFLTASFEFQSQKKFRRSVIFLTNIHQNMTKLVLNSDRLVTTLETCMMPLKFVRRVIRSESVLKKILNDQKKSIDLSTCTLILFDRVFIFI